MNNKIISFDNHFSLNFHLLFSNNYYNCFTSPPKYLVIKMKRCNIKKRVIKRASNAHRVMTSRPPSSSSAGYSIFIPLTGGTPGKGGTSGHKLLDGLDCFPPTSTHPDALVLRAIARLPQKLYKTSSLTFNNTAFRIQREIWTLRVVGMIQYLVANQFDLETLSDWFNDFCQAFHLLFSTVPNTEDWAIVQEAVRDDFKDEVVQSLIREAAAQQNPKNTPTNFHKRVKFAWTYRNSSKSYLHERLNSKKGLKLFKDGSLAGTERAGHLLVCPQVELVKIDAKVVVEDETNQFLSRNAVKRTIINEYIPRMYLLSKLACCIQMSERQEAISEAHGWLFPNIQFKPILNYCEADVSRLVRVTERVRVLFPTAYAYKKNTPSPAVCLLLNGINIQAQCIEYFKFVDHFIFIALYERVFR